MPEKPTALALALALLAGCASPPREPPCNPLERECAVGAERQTNVMKPFPKGPFLNKERP